MAAQTPPLIAPAAHPRAGLLIRRAKGWGMLGGFGVTAAASVMHGTQLTDAILRGFGGALLGYTLAWLAAVTISRHLLKATAKATVENALARRRAAEAERRQAWERERRGGAE